MNNSQKFLEKISLRATTWIGSTTSLVVHTVIFLGTFVAIMLGAPIDRVLLALTTAVSLEAIYLSILIQMSVNRSESRLTEVSHDIEEIQEDVHGIEEDIDEIQEDIDEIQEDVEEIQDDIEEDEDRDHIDHIKKTLSKLVKELEEVKSHKK